MELTYPFRNLTFNNFDKFYESDFLDKFFIELMQEDNEFYREIIKQQIENWYSFLSSHENELNQIVNTSNQLTIDSYFKMLKSDRNFVISINEEFLKLKVLEYNSNVIMKFEIDVEVETEKYHEKENVKKYAHLEEYDDLVYSASPYVIPWGKHIKYEKKKFKNYKFYCIEKEPKLLDLKYFDSYVQLIKRIEQDYLEFLNKYISAFDAKEIVATITDFFDMDKIILHVEGSTDEKYIIHAAKILDKEAILDKIVFVDVGGCSEMDSVWKFYTNHAVDVFPTKRIFLYDCEVKKEDFDTSFIKRRVIPFQEANPIKKGIENLFTNATILKVEALNPQMIDIRKNERRVRGVDSQSEEWSVNKDEKTNLCNWLIENGVKEDFELFNIVFEILEKATG